MTMRENNSNPETEALYHHIAQMGNPDNYGIDVRMQRLNELKAERKDLQAIQPILWARFCECTDDKKSSELLDAYEANVARLTQLDFLISQAQGRV